RKKPWFNCEPLTLSVEKETFQAWPWSFRHNHDHDVQTLRGRLVHGSSNRQLVLRLIVTKGLLRLGVHLSVDGSWIKTLCLQGFFDFPHIGLRYLTRIFLLAARSGGACTASTTRAPARRPAIARRTSDDEAPGQHNGCHD